MAEGWLVCTKNGCPAMMAVRENSVAKSCAMSK